MCVNSSVPTAERSLSTQRIDIQSITQVRHRYLMSSNRNELKMGSDSLAHTTTHGLYIPTAVRFSEYGKCYAERD